MDAKIPKASQKYGHLSNSTSVERQNIQSTNEDSQDQRFAIHKNSERNNLIL